MIGAVQGGVVWLPVELVKIEGRLFKQVFLIAFDGEVVVRTPLFDQIAGQFALG